MPKIKSPLNDIMKIMKIVIHAIDAEGIDVSGPPLNHMVKKLLKRGFKPEDIDVAIRWVASISAHTSSEGVESPPVSESRVSPQKRSSSIRHLHITEALKLTHESQRLLLTLLANERISPLHFERTIEYLLRSTLRCVVPEKLEVILSLTNPTPGGEEGFFLSEKISPPQFIN